MTPTMPRRVKVIGDLFHGRVPDGAIYVGRAAPGLTVSPYHNPFGVKKYGLAESRRWFRAYLAARQQKGNDSFPLADQARRDLAGHDLACWCPIDAEWCHADDLLKLAAGRNLEDL
jgi:hypothetical protein